MARGQCESALETILREGGRRLLQEALELEVQQYIERFQQLKRESGQSLAVRNGYHQERELVIGAGKVPVRQPRVHDRRPTEHFTSAILPPYLRRTPSIDALIPGGRDRPLPKPFPPGRQEVPRPQPALRPNADRPSDRWAERLDFLCVFRSKVTTCSGPKFPLLGLMPKRVVRNCRNGSDAG